MTARCPGGTLSSCSHNAPSTRATPMPLLACYRLLCPLQQSLRQRIK
ncbi:MAG: hypothetical protein IJP80_07125 [Bacteroidales bacterium]|nr:hypothetical protein [Bacteroidales bacterium]